MKRQRFDFPKGAKWDCRRCAKCCGDATERERRILLIPQEAIEIARIKGIPIEDFCNETGLKPFTFTMKKDSRGKCVFLGENECKIYSVRPLVCRFYPFWLERRDDGSFSFNVTDECMGRGFGQILGQDFFIKLFDMAIEKISDKKVQSCNI